MPAVSAIPPVPPATRRFVQVFTPSEFAMQRMDLTTIPAQGPISTAFINFVLKSLYPTMTIDSYKLSKPQAAGGWTELGLEESDVSGSILLHKPGDTESAPEIPKATSPVAGMIKNLAAGKREQTEGLTPRKAARSSASSSPRNSNPSTPTSEALDVAALILLDKTKNTLQSNMRELCCVRDQRVHLILTVLEFQDQRSLLLDPTVPSTAYGYDGRNGIMLAPNVHGPLDEFQWSFCIKDGRPHTFVFGGRRGFIDVPHLYPLRVPPPDPDLVPPDFYQQQFPSNEVFLEHLRHAVLIKCRGAGGHEDDETNEEEEMDVGVENTGDEDGDVEDIVEGTEMTSPLGVKGTEGGTDTKLHSVERFSSA
ncbi:hypothetical protein HK101_006565, partial [Irineochytrium annulatum]